MLNGIEVLNKVELKDAVTNPILENIIIWSLLGAIGFCLLTLLFIYLEGKTYMDIDLFGVIVTIPTFVCLGVFFIALMLSCVTSKEVPNGKYEYQVTITDDVKMKEFNSKYDIIKVDGKIYTIREKEGK